MSAKTIERRVSENRAAMITYNRDGAILVMQNDGGRWDSTIGSLEVAEAALQALEEYVDMLHREWE